MPRSIPLNGFFLYLRDQAASAARSGRGPDPDKGVGVPANAIMGFSTQGVSQPIYGFSTSGQPTIIQGKAA